MTTDVPSHRTLININLILYYIAYNPSKEEMHLTTIASNKILNCLVDSHPIHNLQPTPPKDII
jgi:hypothetical protein